MSLTYALFPQVGLKFLENRGNPDAFEPVPGSVPAPTAAVAAAQAQPATPVCIRLRSMAGSMWSR